MIRTLSVAAATICTVVSSFVAAAPSPGQTTVDQTHRLPANKLEIGPLKHERSTTSDAAGGDQFQFASASRPSVINLTGCTVQVIDDIDVPAHISGPLTTVNFREGQFVSKGDEIARIDGTLAQLDLESARRRLDSIRTKSESDIEIRYARAGFEVAKKEHEILRQLWERRSGSKMEYERAKHAAQEAALKIEKSKQDAMLAQKDVLVEEVRVKSAEELLARHIIHSPIDGNVLEVSRQEGEWVKEGETVLQIVRMDRLYVESQEIDPTKFNSNEVIGKPVTVTIHLARGEKTQLKGKIVLVDLTRRSRNYFTVRAEVENQSADGHWLLHPMASVSMRIHLDSESTLDSASTAPQPIESDNVNR